MPVWWLSLTSARNEDEIVRIVAVAREANPPSRVVCTKIAVDTLDRDVDPVGACIGARDRGFKWW